MLSKRILKSKLRYLIHLSINGNTNNFMQHFISKQNIHTVITMYIKKQQVLETFFLVNRSFKGAGMPDDTPLFLPEFSGAGTFSQT